MYWNWVTIKKLSEMIGYTEDAINSKRKKGIWIDGIHWKKVPDGRILMDLKGIREWIENGKE